MYLTEENPYFPHSLTSFSPLFLARYRREGKRRLLVKAVEIGKKSSGCLLLLWSGGSNGTEYWSGFPFFFSFSFLPFFLRFILYFSPHGMRSCSVAAFADACSKQEQILHSLAKSVFIYLPIRSIFSNNCCQNGDKESKFYERFLASF